MRSISEKIHIFDLIIEFFLEISRTGSENVQMFHITEVEIRLIMAVKGIFISELETDSHY